MRPWKEQFVVTCRYLISKSSISLQSWSSTALSSFLFDMNTHSDVSAQSLGFYLLAKELDVISVFLQKNIAVVGGQAINASCV